MKCSGTGGRLGTEKENRGLSPVCLRIIIAASFLLLAFSQTIPLEDLSRFMSRVFGFHASNGECFCFLASFPSLLRDVVAALLTFPKLIGQSTFSIFISLFRQHQLKFRDRHWQRVPVS